MIRVPLKRALVMFACLVLISFFVTAFLKCEKCSIQSDLFAHRAIKETINRGSSMVATTTTGEKDLSIESILDVPRLSHPTLSRALNDTQYEEIHKLLAEVDRIFTENNITYIMVYGTLLGSYFVHDILPWDDDLDLCVEASDIPKMVALFKQPKYSHMETYIHSGHLTKVKVYFKDSPHAGGFSWRWPFADVSTYKEENGSICCIHGVKQNTLSKESFFPFHKRPIAGLWLSSPRDPVQYSKQKYHRFSCKSQGWNHRREKGQTSVKVSCDALKGYYPMVYRSPEGTGVRETLKLGEEVLYSVHVNETYRGQSAPFDWDGTD